MNRDNRNNPIEWAEEFKLFMSGPELNPPQFVKESIHNYVIQDLNPSFASIFSKLALIHLVIGSLSLLICSQFGMGKGWNLAHAFMKWGDLVCMMACGSLFLGLTTSIAGVILKQAELRRIRETGYSMILLLGLGSLLVFFCFGAQILVEYAVMWLVGAITAGAIGTEFWLGIRRNLNTNFLRY